MPRDRAALPGLVAAALSAGALLGPGTAAAGPHLLPARLESDSYGESYSFLGDLADGTYVQLQLSVTSLGPGSHHGLCRALVVPPSGAAWTDDARFDSGDWSHSASASAAGERLRIGSCSIHTTAKETVVEARLDGAVVRLAYAAPLRPEAPPAALIRLDGASHRTELLLPAAALTASLSLPGRPSRSLAGSGYADHSRSDVPPRELAVSWVRFRAVGAAPRTLVLAREAKHAFSPVWRRLDSGAYRSGGGYTLRRSGAGATLAFEAGFRGEVGAFAVRSRRLLYRHAPVEELGVLGSLVRPFTGSPVTYTFRGVLAEDGNADVPGILEVSLAEE